MDNPRVKNFLVELGALTKRFNIEIGGCGCCGSPWIASIDDGDTYEARLQWNGKSYLPDPEMAAYYEGIVESQGKSKTLEELEKESGVA